LSDLVAYLEFGEGGSLPLWPGREVVARVLRVQGGRAVLALAGSELEVAAEARLVPGATVRLRVERLDDARVALRVVGDEPPPPAAGGLDLTV
jgi:hypothetical protein